MPGLKIEIPLVGPTPASCCDRTSTSVSRETRTVFAEHLPASLPPPSTCLMVSRLRRDQPLAARHLLRRRGKSRRRRTCGPSRLTRDAWGTSPGPCLAEWLGGTRKQDQRSTWNRSCHSVPRVRDSQCPQRPCHVLISRCLLGKPCAPAPPWGTPAPARVQRSWLTLPRDRWDRSRSDRHRDPEVSRETPGRVGPIGSRAGRDGKAIRRESLHKDGVVQVGDVAWMPPSTGTDAHTTAARDVRWAPLSGSWVTLTGFP